MRTVIDAVNRLVKDERPIEEILREHNIKGDYWADSCPIATYIYSETQRGVWVYNDYICLLNDGSVVCPDEIRDFVEDFDAGCFIDLALPTDLESAVCRLELGEVRQRISNSGITGVRNSDADNVLARYLSAVTNITVVIDGYTARLVDGYCVELTYDIIEFLRNFNAGRYPDLED